MKRNPKKPTPYDKLAEAGAAHRARVDIREWARKRVARTVADLEKAGVESIDIRAILDGQTDRLRRAEQAAKRRRDGAK